MAVHLEKIEKNIVKLRIEVSANKFEEALEKSYKKNAGRFNVPGFRKGKATRSIIERHFGEGVFYEDAVGFAYPEAYDLAVKDHTLKPVDFPQIDIEDIGKGKDFVFTATVTVKPEVILGQYLGVEVSKKDVLVSAEQIDEEIKKEQERSARIIKVEDRDSKENDICTIDFEGFLDGVPFEGGKAEGHQLTLGSGQFIPGFEDQLIGKEIEQEIEVNVTFPEEYQNEDLAGKPAIFKVIIHEIKEKKLPELDDDFAKEVSEFETLEEYKNSIRETLQKNLEEESKISLENEVLEKVAENATVEIPEVMIHNRITEMVKDLERNLKHQGANLEMYMKILGLNDAKIREDFKERAEKEVKVSLVIEEISKAEKIEMTDEDLDKKIEEISEKYKETVENIKKVIEQDGKEGISSDIIFRKTIDLLVQNAKVA
jgi:trigger factor